MIARQTTVLLLLTLCLTSIGCASGPKYSEIQDKIPALSNDKGRVFFYRTKTPLGSAVQPSIYINEDKVGDSVPGGFFFVDLSPGNYKVGCSTEVERNLSLALVAGETKYVRTYITMGAFVGHVHPELENKADAMRTLESASYTGDKIQIDNE